MNTLNNTTRTYPRTLSDAFADERANWFEPPPARTPLPYRAVAWTLAIAVVLGISGALVLGATL